MIRTHKIALKPNEEQATWFYQQCGYARFACNHSLYENPRPLKRFERKLKRAQRKLSRKVFLSQNWYKQKRKVERLHYRIACIRKDAHDKATTDIVRRAGRIGIETLRVTHLLKNRKVAKALSDSALGVS